MHGLCQEHKKSGEAGGGSEGQREASQAGWFYEQGGLGDFEKGKYYNQEGFFSYTHTNCNFTFPSNSETSLRDTVLVFLILYPQCLVQCLIMVGPQTLVG